MTKLSKILKYLGYIDITNEISPKVWNLLYRIMAKQDLADLSRIGVRSGERFDELIDLLYELDVELSKD